MITQALTDNLNKEALFKCFKYEFWSKMWQLSLIKRSEVCFDFKGNFQRSTFNQQLMQTVLVAACARAVVGCSR